MNKYRKFRMFDGQTHHAFELPAGVVASIFVNLETYLVLANYNKVEVTIETRSSYLPTTGDAIVPRMTWKLQGKTFLILRRIS